MQEINNTASCIITMTAKELCGMIYTEVRKALAEHKAASTQEKSSDNDYCTAKEVCNILHVSNSTLWRWNNADYLKPIKVGAKSLYKRDDVIKIAEG